MLDQAFEALKTYDYGADRHVLDPIDEAVVKTRNDPAARKEIESKLLAVLQSSAPRDAKDYATGHLPRARNIPLKELPGRMGEIGKFKDKPVIVTDRSAARAGSACRFLRREGFANVFQLKGGVSAWQQASLPVEK